MRSRVPKVLHDLCGRPLVAWPIAAAREAGAGRVVVVDGPDRALEGRLPEGVELAVQPVPDGTGGAVRAAAEHLGERRHRARAHRRRPARHRRHAAARCCARTTTGGAAATIADDGPRGPDRLRPRRPRRRRRASSGSSRRRPGRRDATQELRDPRGQRRRLRLRRAPRCATRSRACSTDNAQGELYLPDVVGLLRRRRPRRSAPTLARRPGARARRQRPRRARAGPRARPAAHPRRPHARRRHDRRPARRRSSTSA